VGIDTPAVLIDTFKVIIPDSLFIIPLDSAQVLKKQNQKRKTKKLVKIFSFFQYKDNGQRKDFIGAEKFKKCAKKGIQDYFMLPPRARTDYSLLLPIFNAMPANTKREFADPRKYPKYYDVQYGYNFHHLNNKCAIVLSTDFGNQLVNVMKK
jgi:hypothetical protein